MKESKGQRHTLRVRKSPPSNGQTRRRFLKSVVATGAAAASLPLTSLRSQGQQTNAPASTSPPALDTTSTTAEARRKQAFNIRVQAATQQAQKPLPRHINNGDEDRFPNKIANYSKGLPHNNLGEVDLAAYQIYQKALSTGKMADFEAIPQGCTDPKRFKQVDPVGGLAFELEGIDAAAGFMPPAPAFGSDEMNAEMIEDYWMALTRDIAFSDYDTNPLTQQAAADLTRLGDAFKGPKVNGQVTTGTLFRGVLPGNLIGPLVSQFRWLPVPFGADMIQQTMMTSPPGQDFMMHFADWLNIQQGCPSNQPMSFDPVRRYIRNGRDAGIWVHMDTINQAYFIAVLMLLYPFIDSETGMTMAVPSPTDPYLHSQNQTGLQTFGLPDALTTTVEVTTRVLKAAWFQKWYVHRRLRPEAYGACIHNTLTGAANYPVNADQLTQSPALAQTHDKYGTYLLSMVFPEGSPLHPSYPSGHATVAGACVTILKAFFDESFILPNPVVPNADGTDVVPYTGPDANNLTVGGELNKLASNVALSRNMAGVHYRSDGYQGLLLGEAVAISILQDRKLLYTEDFKGFTFHKFDGTLVTI